MAAPAAAHGSAASPSALRAAASRVEVAGGRLAPALDHASTELDPAVWIGPAASRLTGDLSGGRRRLVDTHHALVSAAAAMRAEADRREAEIARAAVAAAIAGGRA